MAARAASMCSFYIEFAGRAFGAALNMGGRYIAHVCTIAICQNNRRGNKPSPLSKTLRGRGTPMRAQTCFPTTSIKRPI